MKNFLLSACFGFIALALVNLTVGYTGLSLPVSQLSVAISGVLGVPGVILMIALQFIL